jgi:hypothetical protein
VPERRPKGVAECVDRRGDVVRVAVRVDGPGGCSRSSPRGRAEAMASAISSGAVGIVLIAAV